MQCSLLRLKKAFDGIVFDFEIYLVVLYVVVVQRGVNLFELS